MNEHPYLVAPEHRSVLEAWLREDALVDPDARRHRQLIDILSRVDSAVTVDLDSEAGHDRPRPSVVSLPGDRGGVLFRISHGEGPVSFTTSRADLALAEGLVFLPVAASGTTWTLLTLRHVPDGLTSLYAAIEQEGVSIGAIRFQVTAPVPGRLKLTVLSDDTGETTPAMIQVKWMFDGSTRAPDNAVDFTPQFDSQAATRNRPEGSRRLNLPGLPEGDF